MRGPAVLVGFAESLAAIESVWCLLDQGYDVHCFARPGSRPAIGRDGRVRMVTVTAPETSVEASVEDVLSALAVLDDPVLLPLDDAAVLVADRVSRRRPDLAVAGPTGPSAELALDKRRQLAVAEGAGLAVPPTVALSPGDAVRTPAAEPPWIVKPARALDEVAGRLTKAPSHSVRNESELEQTIAGCAVPMLVQPYIKGTGHGLFGLADQSRLLGPSAHRRVRMMNPSGSGSSACRSVDPDPQVLAEAEAFVRQAGWQGLFMLEFLASSDGTSWFMELNGRAWGSMALAVRRGLPYPAWAVEVARGGELDPSSPPGPHVTARNLGRELLHVAFVARGRHRLRQALREGHRPDADLFSYPTLTRAVADVLAWHPEDRLYNARSGLMRVLIADTSTTVRAALRREEGH